MENKVLRFLRDQPEMLYKPTEIATGIGLTKGQNTAKSVNPSLYALERKGLIKKVAEENGSNPRWTLKEI